MAVDDFAPAMFLEIAPLFPLMPTFVESALVAVGPIGIVPGLSTERVDCSADSEKLRVSVPVLSAFPHALNNIFLLEIG